MGQLAGQSNCWNHSAQVPEQTALLIQMNSEKQWWRKAGPIWEFSPVLSKYLACTLFFLWLKWNNTGVPVTAAPQLIHADVNTLHHWRSLEQPPGVPHANEIFNKPCEFSITAALLQSIAKHIKHKDLSLSQSKLKVAPTVDDAPQRNNDYITSMAYGLHHISSNTLAAHKSKGIHTTCNFAAHDKLFSQTLHWEVGPWSLGLP